MFAASLFIHQAFIRNILCSKSSENKPKRFSLINSRSSQSGRLPNALTIIIPCDKHCDREMLNVPMTGVGKQAGRRLRRCVAEPPKCLEARQAKDGKESDKGHFR